MKLTPLTINLEDYPPDVRPFLDSAEVYDSSCSEAARVVFVDKDGGYFLKSMPAQSRLHGESYMTEYFYKKGFAPRVEAFVFDYKGREFMMTEKLKGDDCTAEKYLEQPEKLCDVLAEALVNLHSQDCGDCLVFHGDGYINRARKNRENGKYDASLFHDNWGYSSADEAWRVIDAIEERGHLFRSDMLIHGDYCLPNIILDDWRFSGFIDLDGAGVGDRHIDLFWALWTLNFNLKTDQYRERFIDAYGRDKVDEEMLRLVAACEVFG